MKRILSFVLEERTQFIAYCLITMVVLICSAILRSTQRDIFVSHLGKTHPLISIPILALFGFACFIVLIRGNWFGVFEGWNGRGYWISAWLSIAFFVFVIILDLVFRFPRNINILFPKSLLYYPVVGYVVNVLFHVVLLTAVIGFLRVIFPQLSAETAIRTAIVLAALVEPIYQMIIGTVADGWTWLVVLTGVHVLFFNLAQLYIFKQYDFTTMYFMRLCYYLLWHISWGMMRLGLLFD